MKYYGYIYKTINNVDRMIYIGKHVGKYEKTYLGSGAWLNDVIKGIGKENFSTIPIHYTYTNDLLNYWEKYYIKEYRSNDRNIGYNQTDGGENPPVKHWSEEEKKIISERFKGNQYSKGVKKTEYWLQFMSKFLKEHPNSGMFQKGEIPWNKGKKCPSIGIKMIGNKNGANSTKGKKRYHREDGTIYYK